MGVIADALAGNRAKLLDEIARLKRDLSAAQRLVQSRNGEIDRYMSTASDLRERVKELERIELPVKDRIIERLTDRLVELKANLTEGTPETADAPRRWWCVHNEQVTEEPSSWCQDEDHAGCGWVRIVLTTEGDG